MLATLRDLAAPGLEKRARAGADGRHEVARSRWLNPTLARRLAKSRREHLRQDVAANPHAPVDVLTRLAGDPKLSVRAAVRTNASVPFETVVKHADCDRDLTEHPHCPSEVLARIYASSGRGLSDAALAHPNLPVEIRAAILARPRDDRRALSRLWPLLRNPATTHTEALPIVSRDDVARWIWAEHGHADPAWLAETSEVCFVSRDQGTIAHIAANPSTPGAVLARIVADHPHREYALANPSCPPEVLLETVQAGPADDHRVTVGSYNRICARVAAHPGAPREAIETIRAENVCAQQSREDIVLRHAVNGAHARMMMTLFRDWQGSVAELLDISLAAVS